jgi:predicted MFS family arabinose efflux permease
MRNRWFILVLLFFVRTVTGIQYQSVASTSTFLMDDLLIDYARLGFLIGLFQLPGIALSLPSGFLSSRFDDKRIVIASLGFMSMGGLIMGVDEVYTLVVTGRMICGVGAVLLNVVLTKMVADWFSGKEIVTAMAVLVSSWPFGIGLGLIFLGPLALATSWQLVMLSTAAMSAIALVLIVVFYRSPTDAQKADRSELRGIRLSRYEILLVTLAGLIWGLFNVGFASLPSFAPGFLTSEGYSVAVAGTLVSVITWVVIPAIPLGGFIAERLGKPNFALVFCFLGIGILMFLLPFVSYPLIWFIALGLLFGPPAGIIVALPAEILKPDNRAFGMGVFYTVYYGSFAALTALAGLTIDLTGNTAMPLTFGGVLLFIIIFILWLFRFIQRDGILVSSKWKVV